MRINQIARSNIARRFLRGAGWGFLGSAGAQALSLVCMIVIARTLGKDVYGEFVLIQSTFVMFGTLAGAGIGSTAVRYTAELKNADAKRLGLILTLCQRTVITFGITTSIAIVAVSPWLSASLLNSSTLRTPLVIAAAAVFFSAVDGYQKSVLVGFEASRQYASGSIIGAAISLPIFFVAARDYGLQGAAFALTATSFLQFLISYLQVNRQLRQSDIVLTAKGCLKEWTILRDFALPALLAGVMVTPAHWACQALLTNTKNGFSEIAILGISMQWFNAILFLPNIASKFISPILTDYVTMNNQRNSRLLLKISVVSNLIVSLPVAIAIGLMSPWLSSLYGDSFKQAAFPLSIAAYTAVLVAVVSPVGNLLAAQSKMWTGLKMNIAWLTVYISLASIVAEHGAIGVISAMATAYLLHSAWVLIWTTRNFLSRG